MPTFFLSTVATAVLIGAPAFAQTASPPDLSGLWKAAGSSRLIKQDLPFTPYGAQRTRQLDQTKDPSAACLPGGPTRGYFNNPFQIVQTKDVIVILFEYGGLYRIIYTDGRRPPDDIHDYPEWMGFSTGTWEGDTLVIETVAIDDRTWLDAAHEHSNRLRLTERVRKTADDDIDWTVTVDDPVFFTEPWTMRWPMSRAPRGDRLMSYSCLDNNQIERSR